MRHRSDIDEEEGEISDRPTNAGRQSPHNDYARPTGSRSHKHSRSRERERSYGHGRGRSRSRSRSPARDRKRHVSFKPDTIIDKVTKEASAPTTSSRVTEPITVNTEHEIDLTLSFEKDEEAELERLREERRRRRKEILQTYECQTDAQNSTVAETVREVPVFGLEKKGGVDGATQKATAATAAGGCDGILAADYDPNKDSKADDVRHRMLAQATTTVTAVSVADPAAGRGTGDASDDDDFDMFADDDVIAIKAPAAKINPTASASAPATADTYDDPDGYYRTIVGELLNGRYLVQAFLGQGVFSSVVRAIDTQNNDAPVAIKIIRQNELMRRAGIKEQRILERLEQADPSGKMHVVRLLGNFLHRGHMCLCFELMSLNLREVVRKYGRDSGLSLEAVRVYGMHLLLALDLLRGCGIIHGDLKPDNCFVSEQRNNVKLGDLGSACDVTENEITPYLVSRFYRAPEIILGMAYGQAIDVWSLGATLFELYTGKIMFPGRNNNHMLQLMMETRGQFPNRILRRGQYWQQHFEDNGGGIMDLVSRSVDELSGTDAVQRIRISKPTLDIKTRVLQATPAGSSQEEIQQALQFASLLDRCLELSPEKRVTPIEALRHPFFLQR